MANQANPIPTDFYISDNVSRYDFYITPAAGNMWAISASVSDLIKPSELGSRLLMQLQPPGKLFNQIGVKDLAGKSVTLKPGTYPTIKHDFGLLFECGRNPTPMGDMLVVHLDCNLV